jgi:hypothetical protein
MLLGLSPMFSELGVSLRSHHATRFVLGVRVVPHGRPCLCRQLRSMQLPLHSSLRRCSLSIHELRASAQRCPFVISKLANLAKSSEYTPFRPKAAMVARVQGFGQVSAIEAFVLIELTRSWLCWVAMRRKDRRVVDVWVNFGGGKNVRFISAIEYARYFLVVALLRTTIAGATVDGSSGDLISVAVGIMGFAKQRTFVGIALIGMALDLASLLTTHIPT